MLVKDLDKLRYIEDSVKRRVFFIGLLHREIIKNGGRPPIVVGGEALEIYTQGGYTTGDIDIKSPKDLTEKILTTWGFIRRGRVWFNSDLDIYIDWLGEGLDEGPEAEERVNTISIGDGLEVKVISIEDLIIDRLNALKWWNDQDSIMWVRVLLEVKKRLGEEIDIKYLQKRAESEGIKEIVQDVLKGWR